MMGIIIFLDSPFVDTGPWHVQKDVFDRRFLASVKTAKGTDLFAWSLAVRVCYPFETAALYLLDKS